MLKIVTGASEKKRFKLIFFRDYTFRTGKLSIK